jgi:hypothetical protein
VGGYVINVEVPSIVDGTHTVVDFDAAETDAESVWLAFDALDRAWILANHPDLFSLYFGEFDRG